MKPAIRNELLGFSALILVANLPLFAGSVAERLAFAPAPVLAGEWWRLLTHPFVHVSWYHLLLDAAAFLMLYADFPDWTRTRRFIATAACGAGSLLAALTSPLTAKLGLCGLSGIAHGLTAIAAMQMLLKAQRVERALGAVLLVGLVSKSAVEAITGEVVFSFLHFGSVGVPITACHAGGVLAGLLFAVLGASARPATAAISLQHCLAATPASRVPDTAG